MPHLLRRESLNIHLPPLDFVLFLGILGSALEILEEAALIISQRSMLSVILAFFNFIKLQESVLPSFHVVFLK